MPKEGGKKISQSTDIIKPYNDKQQWQSGKGDNSVYIT